MTEFTKYKKEKIFLSFSKINGTIEEYINYFESPLQKNTMKRGDKFQYQPITIKNLLQQILIALEEVRSRGVEPPIVIIENFELFYNLENVDNEIFEILNFSFHVILKKLAHIVFIF
jgi:hypothetical protein